MAPDPLVGGAGGGRGLRRALCGAGPGRASAAHRQCWARVSRRWSVITAQCRRKRLPLVHRRKGQGTPPLLYPLPAPLLRRRVPDLGSRLPSIMPWGPGEGRCLHRPKGPPGPCATRGSAPGPAGSGGGSRPAKGHTPPPPACAGPHQAIALCGGHPPGEEAGCGRPEDGGVGTANTVKQPPQQQPAQSQHTNHWAPPTRKQHQQEHRPQRPTERSDPTQHAKGRTGYCPGPPKGTTARRNVTRGGGGARRPKKIVYLKSASNHLEGGCWIKRRCVRHLPPLCWGHLRTIPQGMVPDAQPLVKSSF